MKTVRHGYPICQCCSNEGLSRIERKKTCIKIMLNKLTINTSVAEILTTPPYDQLMMDSGSSVNNVHIPLTHASSSIISLIKWYRPCSTVDLTMRTWVIEGTFSGLCTCTCICTHRAFPGCSWKAVQRQCVRLQHGWCNCSLDQDASRKCLVQCLH